MSRPFYIARFLIEMGDLAIFLKKDGRMMPPLCYNKENNLTCIFGLFWKRMKRG